MKDYLNDWQSKRGSHIVHVHIMATLALLPTSSLSFQFQINPQITYHNKIGCMDMSLFSIEVTPKLPATTNGHQEKSILKQQPKYSQANTRISAIHADLGSLCREGRLEEAFTILHSRNPRDSSNIYAMLLDGCASAKALEEGKQIHSQIISNGLHQDLFLNTKLLSMYSMCLSLPDARSVFGQIEFPNVFLWNAMIRACVWNGFFVEALLFYCKMKQSHTAPDKFTFTYLLKACASLRALNEGKEIHNHIIRSGIEPDDFLDNALLVMNAKCGKLHVARQLFDKMRERNVISWNAMIVGYAWSELGDEALDLFRQMQAAGTKADSVTIASVLRVCSKFAALRHGKEIHDHMVKNGFEYDLFVGSALIGMYSEHQNVACARRVFDGMLGGDVVLWNAMISGYMRNLDSNDALKLFSKMQLAGLRPDSFTFVSVVQACSDLVSVQWGKEIHSHIIKSGFASGSFVGSALVDMYGKCGDVENARRVFDETSERDMGSWNAMIAAYAENGHANEALRLFTQMQLVGVKADSVSISSVLPACVPLAAVQRGKEIHEYMIQYGLESDVYAISALIDMYAKCGNIEMARRVFEKMHKKDVIAWNTIIGSYGMHGHGMEALKLFYQMQQQGVNPVYVTFISVLSACSHAGLVSEGWKCFNQMTQDYHIQPGLEHYSCMVDLLGRAGYLEEAHEFIKMMPIEPDAGVWGALLGACRVHCNVELGEHVAERLFELEPEMPGYYILLSNIYAVAGRWDGVAKVRKMMKERGVKKKPGSSWITIRNKVHEFVVSDKSHPQSGNIYTALENLAEQMEKAGYVPDTNCVLEDVDDSEKGHILYGHSEKLAIAFGIINTYPRSPIQVTKNLRICGDCHNATMFISKITRREIIVRDANRFHCFKDGLCSCSDYW